MTLDNKITNSTDIEQSLNPLVFRETLKLLTNDESYEIEEVLNENGNSDFRENFRSFNLEIFFKINNGENKILFANKYIEISEKYDFEKVTPTWVKEVKKFFK